MGNVPRESRCGEFAIKLVDTPLYEIILKVRLILGLTFLLVRRGGIGELEDLSHALSEYDPKAI